MIKWKSLGIFILTLSIIFGLFAGGALYGYCKALDFLANYRPEILVTPRSGAYYTRDEKVLSNFKEHKDSGYSIMVPGDARIVKKRKDLTIYAYDKDNCWDFIVYQKLRRYDESLRSNKLLNNPRGDYYILLNSIFKTTWDPVLLFQKIAYLPSNTTHIKSIRTPRFFGYYVVGKSGDLRTEYYRLFDEQYWHNISVTVDDSKISHKVIQNMVASLKNDETWTDPDEKGEKYE